MVFPVQFKFRESSDATRRSCLASTRKVGETRGIVIVKEKIERDRRKLYMQNGENNRQSNEARDVTLTVDDAWKKVKCNHESKM